jgi:hypothetical protein
MAVHIEMRWVMLKKIRLEVKRTGPVGPGSLLIGGGEEQNKTFQLGKSPLSHNAPRHHLFKFRLVSFKKPLG